MQDTAKSGRPKKRARRSRAEWVEEVRRWRESGETAEAYAKKHDLHSGTLAGWACKVKQAVRAPTFVPVRVTERVVSAPQQAGAGSVEVVLLNGRRVRISGDFESETVARILAVVEGGERC